MSFRICHYRSAHVYRVQLVTVHTVFTLVRMTDIIGYLDYCPYINKTRSGAEGSERISKAVYLHSM